MFDLLERFVFKQGLTHPWLFKTLLRPVAYARSKGDPERVHELAIEALQSYQPVLRELADRFYSQRLVVRLKDREVMPFGTAAGLDKNGQALLPLSHLFGFMEPGTVVLEPRKGNPRPRIHVNLQAGDLYNAQGFPSRGLDVFEANLSAYREQSGTAPVYASICGLPGDALDLDTALVQVEEIVKRLEDNVDGYVWNPFSPNTDALKALRTPENFRTTAQLMNSLSHERKLRLVKMGPVPDGQEHSWLELVGAWLEGGGDGVVAVNTLSVPKSSIPTASWGYPSAGMSGACLKPHRQRAIKLVRENFSDAIVIAVGGIDSAEDAWQVFGAGANAIEAYTPFTFQGFGLMLKFIQGLERRLDQNGYGSLVELIQESH